jgi:hypothetical protein
LRPASFDCVLAVVREPLDGILGGVVRPILWHIGGEKITMTSYGRDGIPGGTDEDADMIAVFSFKTETGVWSDELCKWEVDPYGR